MNKPTRIQPEDIDADMGPLDENGEQLWSPEEEAAIARLEQNPAYITACERAEADADGEYFTTEEVKAWMAERKREWLAARGR